MGLMSFFLKSVLTLTLLSGAGAGGYFLLAYIMELKEENQRLIQSLLEGGYHKPSDSFSIQEKRAKEIESHISSALRGPCDCKHLNTGTERSRYRWEKVWADAYGPTYEHFDRRPGNQARNIRCLEHFLTSQHHLNPHLSLVEFADDDVFKPDVDAFNTWLVYFTKVVAKLSKSAHYAILTCDDNRQPQRPPDVAGVTYLYIRPFGCKAMPAYPRSGSQMVEVPVSLSDGRGLSVFRIIVGRLLTNSGITSYSVDIESYERIRNIKEADGFQEYATVSFHDEVVAFASSGYSRFNPGHPTEVKDLIELYIRRSIYGVCEVYLANSCKFLSVLRGPDDAIYEPGHHSSAIPDSLTYARHGRFFQVSTRYLLLEQLTKIRSEVEGRPTEFKNDLEKSFFYYDKVMHFPVCELFIDKYKPAKTWFPKDLSVKPCGCTTGPQPSYPHGVRNEHGVLYLKPSYYRSSVLVSDLGRCARCYDDYLYGINPVVLGHFSANRTYGMTPGGCESVKQLQIVMAALWDLAKCDISLVSCRPERRPEPAPREWGKRVVMLDGPVKEQDLAYYKQNFDIILIFGIKGVNRVGSLLRFAPLLCAKRYRLYTYNSETRFEEKPFPPDFYETADVLSMSSGYFSPILARHALFKPGAKAVSKELFALCWAFGDVYGVDEILLNKTYPSAAYIDDLATDWILAARPSDRSLRYKPVLMCYHNKKGQLVKVASPNDLVSLCKVIHYWRIQEKIPSPWFPTAKGKETSHDECNTLIYQLEAMVSSLTLQLQLIREECKTLGTTTPRGDPLDETREHVDYKIQSVLDALGELRKSQREQKLIMLCNHDNLNDMNRDLSSLKEEVLKNAECVRDIKNTFGFPWPEGTTFSTLLAARIESCLDDSLSGTQTRIESLDSAVARVNEVLATVDFDALLDIKQSDLYDWRSNLGRVDQILVRLQPALLATELGGVLEFRHAVTEAIRRRRVSIRMIQNEESDSDSDEDLSDILAGPVNDIIDERLEPGDHTRLQAFIPHFVESLPDNLLVGRPTTLRENFVYPATLNTEQWVGLQPSHLLTTTPSADINPQPIALVTDSHFTVRQFFLGIDVSQDINKSKYYFNHWVIPVGDTLKTLKIRCNGSTATENFIDYAQDENVYCSLLHNKIWYKANDVRIYLALEGASGLSQRTFLSILRSQRLNRLLLSNLFA